MIVTIELNASGIAATAKATVIIRAFKIFSRATNNWSIKTRKQMIKISKESWPLKVSKFFCKGGLRFFVLSNKEAILPISVCIPMAQTIYFPVLWFTRLPEKTMFFLFSKNRFFFYYFYGFIDTFYFTC